MWTDSACTISGRAVLTESDTPHHYTARLTAHQSCRDGTDAVAHENCVVVEKAPEVNVACTVVSTTSQLGYLADDFDLQIENARTLRGVLTANWGAPAVWRRRDGAPVA